MKDIIIIGAGPGGLSSGMLLANKGHRVKIFEKQEYIGGRNSKLQLNKYSFDLGPTFLLMKETLESLFKDTNRNLDDYIKTTQINPMYNLKLSDEISFKPWSVSEKDKMKEEIKKVFPQELEGYENYLKREEIKVNRLMPCLKVPYSSIKDMFNLNLIKSIPYLDAHKSLYSSFGKYFKSDLLKLAFTFQAKYIGMSPWEAPGTFSIISYLEHRDGIHHVHGGLNKISDAMSRAIKEDGGEIFTDSEVKKILFKNKKAYGILLADGKEVLADKVIMNADFAMGMKNLVPDDLKTKFSDEKLKNKKFSCSTFMMYLGVNKVYKDLLHHNIIFAKNYKNNIDEITHSKVLSEDFSFYVHNPSLIDDSLAPKGSSSIYVLVPVPNNKSNIDWDKEKENFRNKILKSLENEAGMTDLSKHIEEERIVTPSDWEHEKDVYLGATFNLGHNLSQMLLFRPHNQLEGFKDLYIVGGGTHPGSGLPTIYESGRITSNLINKE